MTDQERRPRPAAQYGPTARMVAGNVRRLRELRGKTIYELAADLKNLGRAIAPSAVAKIERGERQVTVDDLVALAIALGVSPSALMLPQVDDPKVRVEVTGAGAIPADIAWDWMDGQRAMYAPFAQDQTAAMLDYLLVSRPPRRREVLAEVLSSRPRPVDRPSPEGGDDGPGMD
ncbi:helix-turn-helix domain-containing protein [Streptomyces sp. NPDC056601]|uniref:helix-turn-helix domain-containing protein n=1 Tax=Streptomyces sp. NPDC056601 TaxID=3345875 RepID=UPI0036B976DE